MPTPPDSSGYFWPAGHAIPPGRFAPPSAVPGRLKVEQDGSSRLVLDAPLSIQGDPARLSVLLDQEPIESAIAGVLAGTDQRVLLDRLTDTGRSRRSRGPSQDTYAARHCLVSPPGVHIGLDTRFRWLELDLDGYSDWLGRHGIEVAVGSRAIEARYRRSKPIRWPMRGRSLELERSLDGRGDGRLHRIAWRERNVLRTGGGASRMTAQEAIDLAGRIEDLLTLLADSERRLAFPTVRTSRRSPPVTIYHARIPRGERSAEWHKSWARFGGIKDVFGRIVDAWLARYDEIGAGFYLYLGNRRGLKMYGEHRFASLAWGLEALHRNLDVPVPNDRLLAKIDRILACIPRAKDKAWAASLLRKSTEPNLATRISALVRGLPLGIGPEQANAFGEQCARLRNDISHFGGPRVSADHDDFAKKLAEHAAALDLLYHALLLQQAELPADFIRARFDGGLHSHAAAAVLADCGLTVAGWAPDPRDEAGRQ